MKKGMLMVFRIEKKRVKKINLQHFPVFASKSFVILKLRKPSTDCLILLSAAMYRYCQLNLTSARAIRIHVEYLGS